ncbi:MAG: VRR-NUC domain-containing protein [Planctomycetota bacterium]
MSETDIVRACIEYLRLRGITPAFCWRQNAGVIPLPGGGVRFSGLRGVSDVLGVLPDGCILAIEVKSAKGKMSTAQIEFQDRITASNGVACCVRSVDELAADLDEAMAS